MCAVGGVCVRRTSALIVCEALDTRSPRLCLSYLDVGDVRALACLTQQRVGMMICEVVAAGFVIVEV